MTRSEFEKWLDEAKSYWSENGGSYKSEILGYLNDLKSYIDSLIKTIPQVKLKRLLITVKSYLTMKNVRVEGYSNLVEDVPIEPSEIVPTYANFTLPDYKTLFIVSSTLDTTNYDKLKSDLSKIYSSIPNEVDNFIERLANASIDLQVVLALGGVKTTTQNCSDCDSVMLHVVGYLQSEFNLRLP